MSESLYKTSKYNSKKVDKIIREKYSASFLNNTKWYKLIDALTLKFDEIYIQYKLIYNEEVEGYLFSDVDCPPYFLEPIEYKEVEWIEFPKEYEDWRNLDNLKAGKKQFSQNIEDIKSEIEKIGQFVLEDYENKIRLYAYRK
ncbi:DUF6678 family protein [Aureivirga sp. CE67]|uniref:DUF6678 family protein n=1 Tax=Aureivirga sp. CE67 TaxID=1788983 RepID=UPI0018CA8113|nr:DUF6678 family protein [Aureivirga sp. CE67]